MVLSPLTVVALGYLLFFSSLLGVRSIEVSGLHRVTKAQVLELAQIRDREPLLSYNTGAAEERIGALPQVARVEVGRSLPSTITIEVVERTPLAYFAAGDGIRLVDRTGVPFHRVDKPAKSLPELRVSKAAASDPSTRAAMTVLAGVPEKLRTKVRVIAAQTPGSIELTLAGGKVVNWGDAEQLDRKAHVLAALLSQPGEVYDVSSPELPTIR
jgi:cell division protein FtsQ